MNAWEKLFIYIENLKQRDKLSNEQLNFDSEIVYNFVFSVTGRGDHLH